jgi:small-conductance mechanosensitive channel
MQSVLTSLQGQWLYTGIAALVALVFALIVHWIGVKVAYRVTRFRPVANALIRYADKPAQFVLPLLALQAAWQASPDDLFFIHSLRHITELLLITALAWLAIRFVDATIEASNILFPVNIENNLRARGIQTQFRVLGQTLTFLIILIATAVALTTFPGASKIGTGLLASAGVAGLAVGFAAKPVLGNLLAGLQIAITQPIRLDDVVIVEGEWGRIEEITGTYVVVRIWDQRRLVVPLQWFIEHPFQNWTRTSSEIIGSIFLWIDYRMPIAALRTEVTRICDNAKDWDKRLCSTQVTEASDRAIQIRVLVSTTNADKGWDLRCHVREELIAFVQREYPQYLPRLRVESEDPAKKTA